MRARWPRLADGRGARRLPFRIRVAACFSSGSASPIEACQCSTWNSPSLPTARTNAVSRETSCAPLLYSARFPPPFWGNALGRVIAVANQKGGVGKTTTAVNLAASLAVAEQRTLVIDSDPQSNTTGALGFAKDPSRRTLYHALVLDDPPTRILLKTQVDGLDLIPAEKNLVGASLELVSAPNREYHLKNVLDPIKGNYTYIIIDCPPALDLLTLNALVASDSVLIPIQCEYLALEGVSELLDTLMRIRR